MFRNILKSRLLFRFSSYEDSLQKFSTLTNIQKKVWTLNKNITFYGIPLPTDQTIIQLTTILKTHQQDNPSNTVILLSDCSYNLFINNQVAHKAFTDKFYKEILNPTETMPNDKTNIDAPDSINQCYLLSNILLQDIWTKGNDEDEELDFNQSNVDYLRNKLIDNYGLDPLYSIPAVYSLFQNSQSLCIAGISELLIRKFLSDTNSLQVLKQTFVKLANEINEMKKQGSQDPTSLYYSTLFLFEQYFPEILIGKQAEQLFYLLHELDQDCIILGKTTVQDRLEQLFNMAHPSIHQQIRQAKSVRKLLSTPKTKEQDQIKIQKHALLESIFQSNIWDKPFVYNKFPYLQQDYLSLNPQQQQTVNQRYLHHLNRYKSAWNKLTS